MTQTIYAGVVGFGLGGQVFHAPFLQATQGIQLAAILQRHGEEASRAYPGVDIVRSMEELLALPQLDLVAISTPPATHFALARQALQAGKHVAIDKPFVATSQQAQELIELARSRKLVLAAFQNRRWDGDFLTLQRVLASGELGRLVSLESRFDRYRPDLRGAIWKEQDEPGNGLLLDIGSHLVDQAMVLFGLPEAICAEVRYDREGTKVNDGFAILLHYPRLHVSLHATLIAAAPGPRFTLHGVRGSWVKFGLDPQEDALRGGAKLGSPHWGEEPESAWGKLTTIHNGAKQERTIPTLPGDYRPYYENVRDAILGRAPLAVPAEQGWRIIRLLELALESSREKKTLSCEPLLKAP
jgi:scyllo-inositol 2-dehydrogenase (NADP+)